MTAIGVIQLGSQGVQAGIEQAERAAQEISRHGSIEQGGESALKGLTESSVDLLQAKNQVQASTSVIKAGDDTLGSIINTSV